jgi:hypothetical protein
MLEARHESRHSEVHSGAVGWLSLAAAPTFAIMALTTGILGGGPGFMICPADHTSLLGRHGPDVLADERLSFAALAEADLQPIRSFHSEPVSAAQLLC